MADEHEPGEEGVPDLDGVDQAIRINELTEQAREMGLIDEFTYMNPDSPPGIHEEFLKYIIDYESMPLSCHFWQLEDAGIELPAPESMDDQTLLAKLWEVIRKLAEFDCFLERTDHLSDRELYEHLWHDALCEATVIMPPGSGWRGHLDMIGGCSGKDLEIMHRYYEDEEDRAFWLKRFPEDVLPPREKPPFDRDRHLPKSCDDLV